MSRVLVVGAHPDDEALGCGGALRRHVLSGDAVHAIYMTSGEAGGHGLGDAGSVREEEAQRAAEILGISSVEFWREPDGALRARGGLVDQLRRRIQELEPEQLYVPHGREQHPDHRAAARIVQRALSQSSIRTTVLMCEIWTPLERVDEVIDISAHLDAKLAAIRAYTSQCAVMRFDAAFRGLARYRGEMHSWPDGDYAEAFAHL